MRYSGETRRQDPKALLEDRGLRQTHTQDDHHHQNLSETVDRTGAQIENDKQRSDHDGTRPYHRPAARDSNPDEERKPSAKQHPILIDAALQGRPDQKTGRQRRSRRPPR